MAGDRRALEIVAGRVESRRVLKGTGSEHEGIVLTTADGERLRLQRLGGNPFADAETQALAGHRVELEGYRLGSIFRFTKIISNEEDGS